MVEGITRRDALELLLERIEHYFPEIAFKTREAVNEGKDTDSIETISDESRTQKQHKFRERVQLTDEEALIKVIEILESHFVEFPMAINSAYKEFSSCQIKEDHSANFRPAPQEQCTLAFESGGAGELIRHNEPTQQVIERVASNHIEFAQLQLRQLRDILDIGGMNDF